MKANIARPARTPATVLLSTCDPEALQWEMQQVQLAIARRAYELFQARGREHGHDWEDWFGAEAELLRPVSVAVAEFADRISVRANVLGFQQHELKVAVEPRRIMILGTREVTAPNGEGASKTSSDWYPDLIMHIVDLPAEVLPEAAVVELQGGLLRFELPRMAPLAASAASTAA